MHITMPEGLYQVRFLRCCARLLTVEELIATSCKVLGNRRPYGYSCCRSALIRDTKMGKRGVAGEVLITS